MITAIMKYITNAISMKIRLAFAQVALLGLVFPKPHTNNIIMFTMGMAIIMNVMIQSPRVTGGGF